MISPFPILSAVSPPIMLELSLSIVTTTKGYLISPGSRGVSASYHAKTQSLRTYES